VRAARLYAAALAVGLLATAAAALGIPVRATHGGQAAVDEPQYLLTALSIGEDGSLDISDELRDQRWRAFHDAELPVQTEVLPGGRQVSPHDPLLPVLLALPMRLGGWVAAKAALSVQAGVLAALLVWVAVRRFGVPLRVAAPGVALAACSAPLAVYGQQVYPELPAALVTVVAVAALTGPLRRGGLAALVPAVVALPWLSVKYTPVAAALAAVGLVALWRRGGRRSAAAVAGVLAVSGVAYLAVHRAVWGGLTVYASGDHFQSSGEFGVVGFHPNYPGRSIRLLGLLVDRDFGLGAWQPAWLLAVPAVVVVARLRPPGWPALLVPLVAGWLNAAYVALTMQGYWWPGRQVVVVLPLALLAVLWWLGRCRPAWPAVAAGLGLVGVVYYAVLLVHGYAGDTTWVHAPDRVDLHRPMSWLLPDNRRLSTGDYVRLVAWTVAALAVMARAWSHPPGRPAPDRDTAVPHAPVAGRSQPLV
jgi:hypothetical protein